MTVNKLSPLSDLTQLQLDNWYKRARTIGVDDETWAELMRYVGAEVFILKGNYETKLYLQHERNNRAHITLFFSGVTLGVALACIAFNIFG